MRSEKDDHSDKYIDTDEILKETIGDFLGST